MVTMVNTIWIEHRDQLKDKIFSEKVSSCIVRYKKFQKAIESVTRRCLTWMNSSADHNHSFGYFEACCSLSISKQLLIDSRLLTIHPLFMTRNGQQMHRPSFATLNNNLIFIVDIFVVFHFFTNIFQHSLTFFI